MAEDNNKVLMAQQLAPEAATAEMPDSYAPRSHTLLKQMEARNIVDELIHDLCQRGVFAEIWNDMIPRGREMIVQKWTRAIQSRVNRLAREKGFQPKQPWKNRKAA
jgi:hypothetical protein